MFSNFISFFVGLVYYRLHAQEVDIHYTGSLKCYFCHGKCIDRPSFGLKAWLIGQKVAIQIDVVFFFCDYRDTVRILSPII